MTTGEDLAQSAVEALLEDEALRGSLADRGFGPIITWAAGVALAGAAVWLRQPDPRAAMWDGVARLKDLVRGVVGAAETGAPAPLLEVAGPLTEAATEVLTTMTWGDDPDANAQALVAAIAPLPWADAFPSGMVADTAGGDPP